MMVVLTSRLTYTLLAAALPAAVSAGVSLPQVRGQQANSNTPIGRYIETLDKHGVDVPTPLKEKAGEHAAVAAAAGDSGSAPLTPDLDRWDEYFLVPVEVGGDTLNLKFDTGSSYV